jgi:hypothetical protein
MVEERKKENKKEIGNKQKKSTKEKKMKRK